MNCMRVVPLTAFEFLYYDINMSIISYYFPNTDVSVRSMIAGCFGGGFAYSTVYPIDFCRTMIAVNSVPKKIPFKKTFSHLKSKHGFFNMFKGLSATWAAIFPYTGLKFCIYEKIKE